MARQHIPEDFNEFIKTPLRCFAFIGWNPCQKSNISSLSQRIFYFGLVNLFLYALGQTFVIFINGSSNLLEESPSFVAILYTIICYGKIVTIFLKKDKLIQVLDDLDQIFPRSTEHRKLFQFRQFYKERTIVSRMAIFSQLTTINIFITSSFLSSFYGFLKSGNFVYITPVPMWRTFELDSVLVYAVLYVHQSYGIHFCSTAIMAADVFVIHLVILLCMGFAYVSNEFDQVSSNPDSNPFGKIRSLVCFHDGVLRYLYVFCSIATMFL